MSTIFARFRARRHNRRGHRVVEAPALYGPSHRQHFYCECGKEWVG
jgi:hypothetical protein